jgi:hypothetical protein
MRIRCEQFRIHISTGNAALGPVLRIQTILIRIRIRILLFTLKRIRIWILLFKLIRIRIRLFDTDSGLYRFKELVYLKQYFLFILTWFSLSVGLPGPNQKAFWFKFSLPVDVAMLVRIVTDPDPWTLGNGSRIRKNYPDPQHCWAILSSSVRVFTLATVPVCICHWCFSASVSCCKNDLFLLTADYCRWGGEADLWCQQVRHLCRSSCHQVSKYFKMNCFCDGV